MVKLTKTAAEIHKDVPPDWYARSIKNNLFQKYWHGRRFQEVGKVVEPTGGRILDIGSADGVFTRVIADKSKADEVIGIDVLSSSVSWANKHWKKYPQMKFKVGDAHRLNFKTASFDAVFALEVLEHVFKPLDVLKEIKRVLRRGGYAVFLVPSDTLLFKIIWFFWTKFRGKIWKEAHIQTYQHNYLEKVSKKAGFKVEKSEKFILGMLHLVKARKA